MPGKIDGARQNTDAIRLVSQRPGLALRVKYLRFQNDAVVSVAVSISASLGAAKP